MFSVFPERFFLPRFWTILQGPRPDDSAIDLTAISTLGITTFHIAVEIASCIRFSTNLRLLSTSFLILSTKFISMTISWLALFWPTVDFSKLLPRPLIWVSKGSFSIASALVLLPMMKLFENSFKCLIWFFFWSFFLGIEGFAYGIERFSKC